jgi:hypothetical protein
MEECGAAIRGGDYDLAEDQISEMRDRLTRAINVLNRLR